MVIRGAKTIAEYVIRRWMEMQGFAMGCFTLKMDGNTGMLGDCRGDSLTVEYDPDTKAVYIKEW